MGLLRLELDIDADVYPELYATLTSLVSDASRGERLRQLAAAGLVWEKLRIRGHAALHGVAPEPAWAAVPAAAPLPAPATRAPRGTASGRAPAAARSPAPAPVAPEPPLSAPPGFVDLALDAAPVLAPVPAPPPVLPPVLPSARASAPASAPTSAVVPAPPPAPAVPVIPVAEPWPPVLMDVVEPESYGTAVPVAREQPRARARADSLVPSGSGRSSPTPPTPASMVEAHAPRVMPEAVAALQSSMPALPVDEPRDGPVPAPEPVVEHRSSTRSRLLRMKEKGLFKNG